MEIGSPERGGPVGRVNQDFSHSEKEIREFTLIPRVATRQFVDYSIEYVQGGVSMRGAAFSP